MVWRVQNVGFGNEKNCSGNGGGEGTGFGIGFGNGFGVGLGIGLGVSAGVGVFRSSCEQTPARHHHHRGTASAWSMLIPES